MGDLFHKGLHLNDKNMLMMRPVIVFLVVFQGKKMFDNYQDYCMKICWCWGRTQSSVYIGATSAILSSVFFLVWSYQQGIVITDGISVIISTVSSTLPSTLSPTVPSTLPSWYQQGPEHCPQPTAPHCSAFGFCTQVPSYNQCHPYPCPCPFLHLCILILIQISLSSPSKSNMVTTVVWPVQQTPSAEVVFEKCSYKI